MLPDRFAAVYIEGADLTAVRFHRGREVAAVRRPLPFPPTPDGLPAVVLNPSQRHRLPTTVHPVYVLSELHRLCFPRQRPPDPAPALGPAAAAVDAAENTAREIGRLFIKCSERLERMELAVLLEALRLGPSDWPLRPLIEQAARAQEARGVRARETADWIAPSPRPLHVYKEETLAEEPAPIDPDAAAALLSPQGPVAATHPAYEERPGQALMAAAVAAAMNTAQHLLVEAGTGTGKSLAYLVPALQWARQSGERIVISTHTINLQEQLWEKDIPFLLKALGWSDVKVALLKGRANYVCLRKWEEMVGGADFGTDVDTRYKLIQTVSWLSETETGDRGELHFDLGDQIWPEIQSETETCLGTKCRWYARHCFAMRSRQQARDAQILVVNHALLLSDLKMGGGYLPTYRNLIVDEAHHLEAVATEHLGVSVSTWEIQRALNRIVRTLRALGQPPRIKPERLDAPEALVPPAREANRALGAALQALVQAAAAAGEDEERKLRLTPALGDSHHWPAVAAARRVALEVLGRLTAALGELTDDLTKLADISPSALGGLTVELVKQAGILGQAAADIDLVLEGGSDHSVYWIEVHPAGGRGRGHDHDAGAVRVVLRAAPIHVGPLLRDALFDRVHAVIMTSATLTVDGKFDHVAYRLGLAELPEGRVAAAVVPSPFSYGEQALMLVPDDLPLPQPGANGDFAQAAGAFLTPFLAAVGGRTLVLFTSHRQLRQVYYAVKPELEAQGLRVIGQNLDGLRSQLLAEFKGGRGMVLFGSASFWEGVDIPGAELSCVVMVRLPFAPPDHPVTAARIEHLERNGLSAFRHLSLPQAVIRFKQGFGRLIRNRRDRGVFVVLDARILPSHTRYGRSFLQSLPVPRPRLLAAGQAEVIPGAVRFLNSDISGE